jgi:site-specific recombinase XerD
VNVSAVSPHTLRRTYASDLLNRGTRLEVVSRLLGHSETRTTEAGYARLLDAQISLEARRAYTAGVTNGGWQAAPTLAREIASVQPL